MATTRNSARRRGIIRPRTELPSVRSLVIKVGDVQLDNLGREIGIVTAIASTAGGDNEIQIQDHVTRQITRIRQS